MGRKTGWPPAIYRRRESRQVWTGRNPVCVWAYKGGDSDAQNNQVSVESGPNPENEDLLDLAAAETILNSGQVFAVPREQLPGKGDLAAILRYAVPIP
jgi:hypothetical protein